MAWQDSDITGGKVRLKQSAVASESIGASGLVPGELAVNTADGKIFYKKANGTVGAVPGGATITFIVYDPDVTENRMLVFQDGILISAETV